MASVDEAAVACAVIAVDVRRRRKGTLASALKTPFDRVVTARTAGQRALVVVHGLLDVGLELPDVPSRKPERSTARAFAALGQIELASCCKRILSSHGLIGAQVLLESDALASVAGRDGVTRLLSKLLSLGAVPIVGKNYVTEWEEVEAEDRFGIQIGDLLSRWIVCRHWVERRSP